MNTLVNPKVSVSIITYNHEKYLEECLESIVTQVCDFDFEIVVGEDFSTDGTRVVLKKYVEKYPNIIKPIYQENNVGWQQNYIDVISQCKGKYIAHLDGDDCMLPNKLQRQVDFLELHPECSMVFHNAKIFGENIQENTYNNSLSEDACIIDIGGLVEKGLHHWNNSSKMFRRESLQNFENVKKLQCIGDQYLHIESASRGMIAYIPEVLGMYRKHAEGFSIINRNKDRISCALKDILFAYNFAYKYGVKKEIIDRRLAFVYFDVACQYLMIHTFEDFKIYIEKSYENNIFINKNHKICYHLRRFPHILWILKSMNNLLHKLKGKQSI